MPLASRVKKELSVDPFPSTKDKVRVVLASGSEAANFPIMLPTGRFSGKERVEKERAQASNLASNFLLTYS